MIKYTEKQLQTVMIPEFYWQSFGELDGVYETKYFRTADN